MKYKNTIGFLANLPLSQNITKNMGSYYFHRIVPMSQILKLYGTKLFIFAPWDINLTTGKVQGWYLEENTFIREELKVPVVIGDWTISYSKLKKHGMEYSELAKWLKEQKIKVYNNIEFNFLCGNKFRSYEHISKFTHILQPYTEIFKNEEAQIEKFFSKSETIFLKPRGGAKSDNIAVLKKTTHGITLTYYPTDYYTHGQKHTKEIKDTSMIVPVIKQHITSDTYIIQEGVDILNYNNCPTILRTLLVSDGKKLHTINVTYIGKPSSDVSNTDLTPDNNYPTEKLITSLMGPKFSTKLLNQIKNITTELYEYFNSLFKDEIIEIAFDFALDQKKEKLYLLELNTFPAIIIPETSKKSHIFNLLPEEADSYREYVFPYASHLANFLQRKLEAYKG